MTFEKRRAPAEQWYRVGQVGRRQSSVVMEHHSFLGGVDSGVGASNPFLDDIKLV
ncbi:hypothetical protein [Tateyamaria sp. ANG-S1]|uniref:hypothetical protein n=1 Tax=Tateyamaria sp. ANG-S1 TaxID=1577905 RepID=UPI00187C578E|nr:hypothetical protein [Tateyamaria sp. ANG-S1]